MDGYNMIIEHRTRDKHQNADSLSKKTEFYERQEQREADRPEIKGRLLLYGQRNVRQSFHSRDGWTNQANRLKIIPNCRKSLLKRPS